MRPEQPADAAGGACFIPKDNFYPMGAERARWPFPAEIQGILPRLPNPKLSVEMHAAEAHDCQRTIT